MADAHRLLSSDCTCVHSTHMCAQQGKSARTEGHGGLSTGARQGKSARTEGARQGKYGCQQGKSARMAVCMRQSMRLVVGGVRGRRGFRVLCPYEMCVRGRGISEMQISISEMKISIVAVFSLQSTTERQPPLLPPLLLRGSRNTRVKSASVSVAANTRGIQAAGSSLKWNIILEPAKMDSNDRSTSSRDGA